MTIAADMKLVLAGVLSDTTGLGETWQYRNRTSNRDATAAFSAWADVAADPTENPVEMDDAEGGDQKTETIMVRVPSTANIAIGDQMKNPAGEFWHVDDQPSSGYGTNRFLLRRISRDLLGSMREGGL